MVLMLSYNISRSRSPPEGKATSPAPPPPQLATPLPPSPTRTIHTFAIPKTMGLGIIIAGGLNHEGGPHIYIDRILAGMDAAKVSVLPQLMISYSSIHPIDVEIISKYSQTVY